MSQCNKTIPITQTKITTDSEKIFLLEYSIRRISNREGGELYGLRVDKRSQTGMLLEREETPALTESLGEVTALAKAFAAGTVFPDFLLEMVDECYETFINNKPGLPLGCTG